MLNRVDAATGELVAAIELPIGGLASESSIAAGDEGVWVLSDSQPRTLLVVDPRTNSPVNSVSAPANAAAVRAGFGGVWVSISAPGTVVRLDPRTGDTIAAIPVGKAARFIALGADAVWVMNQQDGTVSRINPATNQVSAVVSVSASPIDGGDIAASPDSVWVRVTDALVTRIDPQRNLAVERIGPAAGSGSLAIANDSLWITAHDIHSLWRLPIPLYQDRAD